MPPLRECVHVSLLAAFFWRLLRDALLSEGANTVSMVVGRHSAALGIRRWHVAVVVVVVVVVVKRKI